MNSIYTIVYKDMTEELYLGVDKNGDNWNVTGRHLFTREATMLNRKLGLHKVNFSPEKMN